MPFVNSPLEFLAAFLIVYIISALSTLALAWFMDRVNRNSTSSPS